VQRLLGAVEIAEQADQRGQYTARLGAINRFDRPFDAASLVHL
jgi:hypothetical protein